jgi:predicted TIM-barrel fold metal-dependent hydrolase
MKSQRIIDTHAHIIDPGRFPFAVGPGYKPKPHESGTAEAYCATLDASGVAQALLVQPSGYGYDNRAMLDAMARYPGRFKAIAVVDPASPERTLLDLAVKGVVGVRFNLQSYRGDALDGPGAERFLAQHKSLGWFAQVFADDAKWVRIAAPLRRSGVKVLVDHFGVGNPAAGVAQPGFSAVLELGRAGNAAVKLSAPFRLSGRPDDFSDLDPFVEALLIGAFGIGACVWGSDWPFLNLSGAPSYAGALRAVGRWLDTADRRTAVLRANPARLFGFGS